MQADKDIGKVALGTPVAICMKHAHLPYLLAKSVELFLEEILKAAIKELREPTETKGKQSIQRITPANLYL